MKKIISLCLLLTMLFCLAACNGGDAEQTGESVTTTEASQTTTQTTTAATEPPQPDPIEIAQGERAKLYIVMPEGCNNTTYAKDQLFYYVKNTAGASLVYGAGSGDQYELLLGDTGREESVALKASLQGDSYAVKVKDNKIIIAATNPAFLYEGVTYLIENLLAVEGDRITLNTLAADHVGQGDTTSLRYLFTQSKTLLAAHSRTDGWPNEIVKKPAGTQYTQGGCSDGEYIYQGFIKKDTASNEVNNVCMIVKIKPDFDPKTSDVVLTSGPLDLNHTNDITYNAKTHELFVCHNNPYRTKVSVIDPDTLTLKRVIEIDQNIYSLSYDRMRDRYVVGMSGGQNMICFDGEFSQRVTRVYPSTPDTAGITTQGICSDDTFIYHTLWNSKGQNSKFEKNVITVYDWYGNYVGIIYTRITIESENIFVHDGELYVSAFSSGAQASYIYRIDASVK